MLGGYCPSTIEIVSGFQKEIMVNWELESGGIVNGLHIGGKGERELRTTS